MKNYIILTILTILPLFAGCGNNDETPSDNFHIDYVPQWNIDNAKYEHSMQIICTLRLNNYLFENTNDMIAAFINDECVGYAKPVDSENTSQGIFLLTVFGNSVNDVITFKMYDAKNSRLIDANNIIEFIPSGILGSISEPLDISQINN